MPKDKIYELLNTYKSKLGKTKTKEEIQKETNEKTNSESSVSVGNENSQANTEEETN